MYEDKVESPEEELKRADHLVFVSLKYTRTCDIMKNAIKRMIIAFELAMTDFLENRRKSKQLECVPGTVKEKATLVKAILGNPGKKYLALYSLLKKIDKSDYTTVEEFRKHVTLKVKVPKPLDVKVVDLYRFLDMTKEFVSFIRQRIK